MKRIKTFLCVLLIATGVLSIIFGITVLDKSAGLLGKNAAFGGDFYTIINDNAERIADNTHNTNVILKSGFGFLLIIIGLLTLINGIIKALPVESTQEIKYQSSNNTISSNITRTVSYNQPHENSKEAVRVAVENGKIFCPNCGTVQNGDRKSCSKCGQPFLIDKTESVVHCPYCDAKQSADRKTCIECGKPLM